LEIYSTYTVFQKKFTLLVFTNPLRLRVALRVEIYTVTPCPEKKKPLVF